MAVTKIFNKKGFSLVEVLAATAIIGGSVVVASYFAVQQSKMISKSDEKVEALGAEMEILSRSVRILTDVRNSANDFHTEGLCTFVDTDVNNYGIGNVVLNFKQKNVNNVFSLARWKSVMGEDWIVQGSTPHNCSTGGGTLCLKLADSSPLFQKIKGGGESNVNAYGKVVISPTVVFEKFGKGGKIFPSIPFEGEWDAKTVGFNIVSEVIVSKDGMESNRKSESSEFLWAADVEYCHIARSDDVLRNSKTNEPIRVLASATGPGDPEGKKVYNATQYKKTVDHPVSIQIPRVVPTQGKHENGRSQVDSNFNIEVACQEKVYRCPQDTDKDREFSNHTNFNFFANYTSANTVTSDPFVKFAPKLSFISNKSNQDIIANHQKAYFKNQTDPYMYYQDQDGERFYQAYLDGANGRTEIRKEDLDALSFNNRQKLAYQLNQTGTWMIQVRNTGQLCNRICEGRKDSSELFFPKIDYKLYDIAFSGQKHYSHSHTSQMPVGCNVCYSKMCQGRTYKNFGAIQATGDPRHGPQPYEPVDGVMPECALRDQASVNDLQPYPKRESNPNQCVAGIITANGIQYVTESCSSQLPVMCFAFGNYMVAKDHFSGGGVSRRDFAGAGRRCYEMGKERLDRESMKGRFVAFNSNFNESFPRGIASASSGNVTEYVNNAKAGMFLAPHSDEQVREMVKFINIYQKDMMGQKVWLGLRSDAGGDLIATPPEIHTADNNREQFSVYYDSTSTIQMVRQNYHIRNIASPGSSAGLLVHNVRFRGVIPANATQSREFPFLCRKRNGSHEYFITSRSSNSFSDGQSFCQSQDGHFIPPTTPLGWAQSFQQIHANDTIYAYPDPKQAESDLGKLPVAWVAVKQLSPSHWDLADTERVSRILSGTQTSKVNKYGEYLSEKIPDPVVAEEKARKIASAENSISSLESEINSISSQISDLDPADDKDKIDDLKDKKKDLEGELSDARGALADAKNMEVPLIPRPTQYVMCEDGKDFKLLRSSNCNRGDQIEESDLVGILDRIKWIIASESMPEGAALQLRR